MTAIRDALDLVRGEIAAGKTENVPAHEEGWASIVDGLLLELDRPSLRGVINATGVVLHTNLGRAPLSEATRRAMAEAGRGYSNLEFDLQAGQVKSSGPVLTLPVAR